MTLNEALFLVSGLLLAVDLVALVFSYPASAFKRKP